MIVDEIKNYEMYASLINNLEEGMNFAQTLIPLPEGRYEAEHGIFALVQENMTTDITDNHFESHQKYLDVQIVVDGCEEIAWANRKRLEVETPYQPEKDLELYKGAGQAITVLKDQFYIMYPQDAHKCCGNVDGKGYAYKKIVLKLPL